MDDPYTKKGFHVGRYVCACSCEGIAWEIDINGYKLLRIRCNEFYILLGFGGFLFALPKLLIGVYVPEFSKKEFAIDVCFTNKTAPLIPSSCETHEMSGQRVLHAVIFIIAQLIMGAGTAPIRTLGKT